MTVVYKCTICGNHFYFHDKLGKLLLKYRELGREIIYEFNKLRVGEYSYLTYKHKALNYNDIKLKGVL